VPLPVFQVDVDPEPYQQAATRSVEPAAAFWSARPGFQTKLPSLTTVAVA
jgi:hypothetical protein